MPIPTEIRLKSADAESRERFNYTGMHRYLLTLPAHGPGSTFASREQVTPILDALRDISRQHHFDVYAYCFLPDRLLLIVRGKDETSQMKMFLRAFRGAAETLLAPSLGHPLWSKKYLERVLRKTEVSSDVAKRIFGTPVSLGLASGPGEYPLQGSFVKDLRVLFGGEKRPAVQGRPAGRAGGRGGGPFRRSGEGRGNALRGGNRTGPPGDGKRRSQTRSGFRQSSSGRGGRTGPSRRAGNRSGG